LAEIFLTPLAIEWLLSFPPHLTSAPALPGKTDQANHALKRMNKLQ